LRKMFLNESFIGHIQKAGIKKYLDNFLLLSFPSDAIRPTFFEYVESVYTNLLGV